MPAASVWQLMGSLLIALIVYRLATRQFRANKWWEKRVARYTELDDQLYILKQSTDKLARHEDWEKGARDTPIYTPEELVSFNQEATNAVEVVQKEIERESLLLSKAATSVLIAYESQRATSYERSGMSPFSTWASDAADLYDNFHGRAKVEMGAARRSVWWLLRGWRRLRPWLLRRTTYLRGKYSVVRRKLLEWSPSTQMDEAIQGWLRREGWEPRRGRYDVDRKLYLWDHQRGPGGTSVLVISRQVLRRHSPADVMGHLDRLGLAQAKRSATGRQLAIVVQRGEAVLLEDWWIGAGKSRHHWSSYQ